MSRGRVAPRTDKRRAEEHLTHTAHTAQVCVLHSRGGGTHLASFQLEGTTIRSDERQFYGVAATDTRKAVS